MSASPATPSYAVSPFDHPRADVILRSSDNIDFRVFKLFLSLASPVFETMFGLPQPAEGESADEETRDGLPVVPVSEASKTLDALMRFCYPCTLAEDPSIENYKDVTDVLDAAKKYSLDTVTATICKALFIPQILKDDSLRCFVVALRAGLREQCILAAKYSLREPLVPGWFDEIQLISSTDLLALLTYHWKCADAVQALKRDLSWIKRNYTAAPVWIAGRCDSSSRCISRSTSGKYYDLYKDGVAQWWEEFMEATFETLKDKPCAETVKISVDATIQKMRSHNCSHCPSRIAEGMREFSTIMINKVEKSTEKIQLGLMF
ncbi:hypothetical protein V8B97DRAFT_1118566 [Scleroderma yunnanense]